jgi:hypothetical protein
MLHLLSRNLSPSNHDKRPVGRCHWMDWTLLASNGEQHRLSVGAKSLMLWRPPSPLRASLQGGGRRAGAFAARRPHPKARASTRRIPRGSFNVGF